MKKELESLNLINIEPARVFNCDERNIQFCPNPEDVLREKGARSVYKIVDALERECMTTLFLCSAAGKVCTPMLMFAGKTSVPPKVLSNCPEGWGLGISDTGWNTTESMYQYVTNVWYPRLVKEKIKFPVILWLDGHKSHITIPLVQFCKKRT